ncbi:NADP-dependent oxidoreductase [Erythrobacter sp.]|uniref:NADP-dependent oxidoreductase n=1 Tax=Erythrobacter sp. TaxID=1042 RepID=UPI001425E27F|nr:NADP-dependent oxidoreductase [Erythrobacter sp.]QIQ87051.1 MAG: NADP-dependent oxidoreductase [Erythrobacter sp.]
MSRTTRQIVLAARPQGVPQTADFRIEDAPLAEPGEGEVLVRNLWLSVDPYMRIAMGEEGSLHGTVPLGDPISGGAVGEVIASRAEALPKGSFVMSRAHGWREAYVVPAADLVPVDPATGPVQRHLGLYGLTGITAWGGVRGVLDPQPGETVFVNAAAGAVGSVAVQLAKAAGARVIASAGSAEKGAWLTGALGADQFIDYREEDVAARLAEIAPSGLDAAFDNVGGNQLEILLDAMAPRGRIALCGAIARYDGAYRAGPANLFAAIEKHVSLTGFNAGFYFDRAGEIISEFAALERAGKLVVAETVAHGLDAMPGAFIDLLAGRSRGKMLVKL